MNLAMSLKDYLVGITGVENQPLSMELLLKPFHISFPCLEEPTLLTGLVIDQLASEFEENDIVDPLDVAEIALDFGYEEAQRFLETAPSLILKMMKHGALSEAGVRRRGASTH